MGLLITSLVLPVAADTHGERITVEKNDDIPDIEERPYSSHFFPKDFLAWEFSEDADAIHNVSKVPLAKRVQGDPINENQSKEAKVVSLPIANKNTSGTPSQGSTEKAVYNFTNWQYVDVLVGWAGSAGEGIIVPPSGDLVDVGHRNGVPVMGTVFFPPTAYGGQAKWIDEFLVKDDQGNFPMADKLIEMAQQYGFDGWFINQETSTGNAKHGSLFLEFLAYYNNHKSDDLELVWYDSMLENGSVSWQNQLNSNNEKFFQNGSQRTSDYMFLNFWFNQAMTERSRSKAIELGRSPYDVLAGFDVQARGINSSDKLSNAVGNDGKALTSVGLYAPDWTLRDGGQYNVDAYWKNESDFWINKQADPRDVSQGRNTWQGLSRYFVEKTPVTSLPFHTSFNVGNGDNYSMNGKVVKEGTFNNRSVQDIMPTYRWIIDQTDNELKAYVDYKNVYNGGTSIGLNGKLVAGSTTLMDLFASDVSIQSQTQANLKVQGKAHVKLKLTFADDQVVLVDADKVTDGTWTNHHFDLSAYSGKSVKKIGVSLTAKENADNGQLNIGYLGLDNKET